MYTKITYQAQRSVVVRVEVFDATNDFKVVWHRVALASPALDWTIRARSDRRCFARSSACYPLRGGTSGHSLLVRLDDLCRGTVIGDRSVERSTRLLLKRFEV